MVVHSPNQFQVQRTAAAAAATAAATPVSPSVPPSVLAASTDAAASAGAVRSAIEDVAATEDADLLGEAHGFDAWTAPPGQRVEAEVHSGREEEHSNVTVRGEKLSLIHI